MKAINIKGAKVHNLKEIDVTIPKNKLVVATGVSGSGKSSLMFDLVFEEGRKQYLQSLGMLSDMEEEHKFNQITGIGPTIAVKQGIIRQSNPRSTVGTRTNLWQMLSLLYAGEGCMRCSVCGHLTDHQLLCPHCGQTEARLSPSCFSPNTPNGMCLTCSGRGSYFEINLANLLPDRSITLAQLYEELGITPGYLSLLRKRQGAYFDTPFSAIPEEFQNEIIYGKYENGKRSYCVLQMFEARYQKNEEVADIYTKVTCSDCEGFRVGEEARQVLLGGKHIGELGLMTLSELASFLREIREQVSLATFSQNLLTELSAKLKHLLKSHLGHLSLYREMPTLSGGEIQRLFLNVHLDSQMDSLIYVLDEPTAGLHESEKLAILQAIKELKELGNTVIVVEHDQNTIQMADHIIDIGPKAGISGGEVVYQGDVAGLLQCEASITGQYLSGKIPMPTRKSKKVVPQQKQLIIHHAKVNYLKDLTVSIPLGVMVGIAGKSGSGKSSLIAATLLPQLKAASRRQMNSDSLEGAALLAGYAEISQAPIGRNMNSNPATYLGIWDKIRQLFAEQPAARKQHYTAGHFSFNRAGACVTCGGSGQETIWLGGQMNLEKVCPDCKGKRFNAETLAITYQGKTIADILEMSVTEAVDFFSDHPGVISTLTVMEKIGMGYIKLGQPTPTLSGGEAQRIKLAKEIGRKRKGHILYILDEPTTGLSLYDIAKLLELLDELVATGNSVVVIEHDPEVLKVCDWLIELGPEGGAAGGYLVAEGTPESLIENPASITGRYLS
ncbi:excinuclease ABC subunit UvrA [Isobaculum melis]|uniref:UvrABC system protein A n=1 Tax=Isobaculum melis TaxID=142588 RepID=A0A1H9QUD8_9LACT|nr:excinuclease ABC subunit UvrA [Isobaculum melis]SER63855.1 excinuclease ABC, A subunit [Isobaculum melis]